MKIFAFLIGLVGVVLTSRHLFYLDPELEEEAFLLGLAIALAEGRPAITYASQVLSLGSVITLAALFLFGLPVAVAAQLLGQLLHGLARGVSHYTLLFNLGQGNLATVSAGLFSLFLPDLSWRPEIHGLLAHLGSGIIFYAVKDWVGRTLQSLYEGNGLAGRGEPWTGPAILTHAAEIGLALVLKQVYPSLGWPSFLVLLGAVILQPVVGAKIREVRERRVVDRLIGLALRQSELLAIQKSLELATTLAERSGLESAEVRQLRYAVLFRWVGLNRLTKQLAQVVRPLKRSEWERIKEHPLKGFRVISGVRSLVGVARILRHHHERFAGGGYPDGLRGEEIPVASRILSLVEAYEAMTCYRGYRARSLSHEEALKELEREAGQQFDPALVRAFSEVAGEVVHRTSDDRQAQNELNQTILRLRQYVSTPVEKQPWDGKTVSESPLNLLEEIQRKVTGVMALHDLSRIVNASLSLEKVINTVLRTAGRTLHGRAALLLLEESQDSLEVYEVNRYEPVRRVDLGQNPSSRSVLEKKPVVLLGENVLRDLGHPPVGAFLSVPLLMGGRAIGALEVRRFRSAPFLQEEISLLSVIASQAALALENARLFRQLESQLAEISELKAFNDLVIQNVSHAILVVGNDGWVRLANPAAINAYRDLGFEASDLLTQPYAEFIRAAGWRSHLLETLHSGQPLSVQNSHVWGPAHSAIWETRTAPLRDSSGRQVGALAFFKDVTRQRQLEQQMLRTEKLAAVGELAAGAAHEIRNPLTAIRGFVQLLQSLEGPAGIAVSAEQEPPAERTAAQEEPSSGSVTTEPQPLAPETGRPEQVRSVTPIQEYLAVIQEEIDHIDRILGEMLVLAKPSRPLREEIKLADLISETCWLVRGKANAQGVALKEGLPRDLPPVQGDRQLLKQAFLNIFTNALQAMPQGGELRVIVEEDRPGQRLVVRVQDTGVGIPTENLERIFAPFFTTRESGTGLGLPISQNIIGSHGGTIEVESCLGQGTNFTVTLPVNYWSDREEK
ncbi:MAG: ATP-binding protein [Firmicutes bacterium]|nr:ATP-binding protein [Bacillota bacterium]